MKASAAACFLLLLVFCNPMAMGQTGLTVEDGAKSTAKGGDAYEATSPREIVVRLSLAGIGELDVIALQQDTVLFIPVLELFSLLQINAEPSPDRTRISGFFIDPRTRYDIDPKGGTLVVGVTRMALTQNNAAALYSDIYLSSEIYTRAFGIILDFDPVHLYVRIRYAGKFPVELIMQRLTSRRVSSKADLPPADITLERERHLLSGGMLDWRLGVFKSSLAGVSGNVVARAGAELLGGDISGAFSAQSDRAVDWNSMPWRWRYVANEAPWFRQAIVGWLSSDLGTHQSLRGATVNSHWYKTRREFDTYSVERTAQVGDEIELYSGNVLLDVITVDSSGRLSLNLPLKYGANLYTLRHIKSGVEESDEQLRIDIPQGTLPAGEFQYKLTAGELQYRPGSNIAEGTASLGLGKHVTLGAGMQMLRHNGDRIHPALFFSTRVIDNLWLDASALVDAVSTAAVSWATMSNITASASFQRFDTHPLYNPGVPRSDYRSGVSFPLGFMPMQTWFSVFAQHQRTAFSDNSNVYSILNLGSGPLSARVATQARWSRSSGNSDTEQNLTVFYQPFSGITMNAGISFNYAVREFTVARASLYTHLMNGLYATTTWYAQLQRGYSQIQISLNWRLPQARLETRGEYQTSVDAWTVQQRASGTVGYDRGTSEILFHDQSWTDRSAVTLLPFLDRNADDVYSEGEELLQTQVPGRIERGQRYAVNEESETRFVNLDQYDTYRVGVDVSGFPDPVWVSTVKTIDVTAEPNQFKPIYLPVYQGGEVQGSVSRVSETDTIGHRGIRVSFTRLDQAMNDAQVTTYSDGSYALFGLRPGRYEARVDTLQARILGYTVEPEKQEFTLMSKDFGDLRENIDFYLIGRPVPIAVGDEQAIDSSRTERLPDSAVVVIEPIADADTLRDKSPTTLTPPDTTIGFVPIVPGVTERLPIDLAHRTLDSTTTAWLDRLIKTTRGLKRYSISVEGHSDNFGGFKENQQRSELRAAKILDYLIKGGVPRRNIQVQSFGSRRPIAPNTTTQGRTRNNRVEVRVIVR